MRVFITGASSGLGRALAERYDSRDTSLGLVARRSGELEAFAATAKGACALYPVDVRNADGMREAAQDFIARYGCPDLVIANAGISAGTASDRPEDLQIFSDIFATNVLGMANTLQPFIAPMRAARHGTLAGIASVAAYRGLPGAGAYSASKAAAIAYLESLRVELYDTGVRVTTVSPGYIATPMTAQNPYRMPFMLDANDAAQRIARMLAQRRSYAVIPWQMAIVARLLRLLPDFLYDRVFAHAPRKPRRD
jgi:short-subunit dehydrogenase